MFAAIDNEQTLIRLLYDTNVKPPQRREQIHKIFTDNMMIRVVTCTLDWMQAAKAQAVLSSIDNGEEPKNDAVVSADPRFKQVLAAIDSCVFVERALRAFQLENNYLWSLHRLIVCPSFPFVFPRP